LIRVYPRSSAVSAQNLLHHPSADIGQAEVAAGVAVGEAGVVQAEEVKDGGVQVVEVDLVGDGVMAEVVGGAEGIRRDIEVPYRCLRRKSKFPSVLRTAVSTW
jgi:hypothetical protein